MQPNKPTTSSEAAITDLKQKIESESASITAFYKDVFGEINTHDDENVVLQSI